MKDKIRTIITTITIIMYHVSAANGFSIIQGFIFIAGIVRNMKQVLNEKLISLGDIIFILYENKVYIYHIYMLTDIWVLKARLINFTFKFSNKFF